MPELPEVETVRSQLDEQLAGTRITSVQIFRSGREFPLGEAFVERVLGKDIVGIERRAKLLIWKFADGEAMTAHLKMTGKFVFVQAEVVPQKHDRILFGFSNDEFVMWTDVRQFGFLKIVSGEELASLLEAYGPEPLEASWELLAECLNCESKRSVKSVLLDQAVIAGLGNIYTDEALFRSSIRPDRLLMSLTDIERQDLARNIQEVLSESVARNGTSANDYVDTRGIKGTFRDFLRVYGKRGEPCRNCQTPIEKITHAQRGTHYCPTCQK
jgi:formamidopyrimidine-DNA glycosylase